MSKEVERRSIYALLAKPISRPQFVARQVRRAGADARGQRGGDDRRALRRARLHDLDRAGRALRAGWDAPGIDPALLKALFLIFVELMLITAIALFFSTFSTPLLSAALTFGLYVVGHFNADLRNFERSSTRAPRPGWRAALYHVLPDLSAFDVKTQVVHGLPVPAGYLAHHRRLTASLYIAVLLLLATLIFSRRDFK